MVKLVEGTAPRSPDDADPNIPGFVEEISRRTVVRNVIGKSGLHRPAVVDRKIIIKAEQTQVLVSPTAKKVTVTTPGAGRSIKEAIVVDHDGKLVIDILPRNGILNAAAKTKSKLAATGPYVTQLAANLHEVQSLDTSILSKNICDDTEL